MILFMPVLQISKTVVKIPLIHRSLIQQDRYPKLRTGLQTQRATQRDLPQQTSTKMKFWWMWSFPMAMTWIRVPLKSISMKKVYCQPVLIGLPTLLVSMGIYPLEISMAMDIQILCLRYIGSSDFSESGGIDVYINQQGNFATPDQSYDGLFIHLEML